MDPRATPHAVNVMRMVSKLLRLSLYIITLLSFN